ELADASRYAHASNVDISHERETQHSNIRRRALLCVGFSGGVSRIRKGSNNTKQHESYDWFYERAASGLHFVVSRARTGRKESTDTNSKRIQKHNRLCQGNAHAI